MYKETSRIRSGLRRAAQNYFPDVRVELNTTARFLGIDQEAVIAHLPEAIFLDGEFVYKGIALCITVGNSPDGAGQVVGVRMFHYPRFVADRAWKSAPHPHVNDAGSMCVGGERLNDMMQLVLDSEYVSVLAEAIGATTTYTPTDAYRRIPSISHCEYCGEKIVVDTASREYYGHIYESGHACSLCSEWYCESCMIACEKCGEFACQGCSYDLGEGGAYCSRYCAQQTCACGAQRIIPIDVDFSWSPTGGSSWGPVCPNAGSCDHRWQEVGELVLSERLISPMTETSIIHGRHSAAHDWR